MNNIDLNKETENKYEMDPELYDTFINLFQ